MIPSPVEAQKVLRDEQGRRYRIGKRRVVAGQQILGVALRSEDHKHGHRKLLSHAAHYVAAPAPATFLTNAGSNIHSRPAFAFSDRYVMGCRGTGSGQINLSGQCRDNDNEDEPAISRSSPGGDQQL